MSLTRKVLRARKRAVLRKELDIDRFAQPNQNGAAARRRRKRRGEVPHITRAVLKKVN